MVIWAGLTRKARPDDKSRLPCREVQFVYRVRVVVSEVCTAHEGVHPSLLRGASGATGLGAPPPFVRAARAARAAPFATGAAFMVARFPEKHAWRLSRHRLRYFPAPEWLACRRRVRGIGT